ncbi:hypothetical protein PR202_ga27310 [Eleusine coracana subsp. coracana]|uniref:Uncharacterized protein n=1 Tax=Eleusine coracana subsp. coracana TaxID=191504 RepID=A0AAV5DEH1_ELECO|nr:hypothetical protein PR202_ga27310 [Eleusine coracana subsp. coracana]
MRARIRDECPGADVLVMPLDLSSLASVRAFADRFLDLGLPLHLLINNAGKFSHGQLALSEDGVEMTFATNYLGHFLLTKLLVGRMAETAAETGVQGRIVNVSSSVHGWFAGDWAEYLQLVTRRKIPYDATQAYAVSKLANVLHTKALAARLQAAATTCYVAAHPRVAGVTGRYFADCNEALPSPAATSNHEAARLWQISEAMIHCTNRPKSTCLGAGIPLLFPQIVQEAGDDQ